MASEFVLAHLRSGGVSRVVYGAIIGLALIVTLQLHPPERRCAMTNSEAMAAETTASAGPVVTVLGAGPGSSAG